MPVAEVGARLSGGAALLGSFDLRVPTLRIRVHCDRESCQTPFFFNVCLSCLRTSLSILFHASPKCQKLCPGFEFGRNLMLALKCVKVKLRAMRQAPARALDLDLGLGLWLWRGVRACVRARGEI